MGGDEGVMLRKGLPCGSAGFVQELGKLAGRLLEYRPQSRPSKVDDGNKGIAPFAIS